MGHVALMPSHVLLALLQPDVDTTDALSSMSSGLYHSASRLHSNPGNDEFKEKKYEKRNKKAMN